MTSQPLTWCVQVLFILVSEEQLSQLVLHPTVMMHWPSMRLPAAHCLTNASLLEALGSACNPRGGPNVYKFEPEGLASGEYELRQTMNGQDHRTTYWLVAQGSPALVGGADNAALERSNLSQAGNPETSPSTACVAPRPVNTFNDLCVIAVRCTLPPPTLRLPLTHTLVTLGMVNSCSCTGPHSSKCAHCHAEQSSSCLL